MKKRDSGVTNRTASAAFWSHLWPSQRAIRTNLLKAVQIRQMDQAFGQFVK
jgi:hypothetical protein